MSNEELKESITSLFKCGTVRILRVLDEVCREQAQTKADPMTAHLLRRHADLIRAAYNQMGFAPHRETPYVVRRAQEATPEPQ